MKTKDEQIIKDATTHNTPIFVLTMKDSCTLETLQSYLEICTKRNCPVEHLEGIRERIAEFSKFQVDNWNEVNLPD